MQYFTGKTNHQQKDKYTVDTPGTVQYSTTLSLNLCDKKSFSVSQQPCRSVPAKANATSGTSMLNLKEKVKEIPF